MNDTKYAEVFPPGEFLREELEARNWTQLDLAEVIGKSPRLVNEVILAKRAITAETASALSKALGTSAELWMNLESVWQLSKLSAQKEDIAKRAKLYGKFPVKEILKRGWIADTENLELLEARFLNFYELPSLDQDPHRVCAFRRKNVNDTPTSLQLAWLYRARQIAKKAVVSKFSPEKLRRCFTEIKPLLSAPEEIRRIQGILSETGIRFVIIEAFQGSKVDGVCFWLDENCPVIAISIRFDRIDWFWFTLIHELRHIANGDGKDAAVIDLDLVGDDSDREDINEVEQRADKEACEFLIQMDELSNFITRVRPLYAEVKVVGFADRMNVHPGIVVGRLQKLKEIPYANLRKHLVKIRYILAQSALMDGWQIALPSD